MESYWASHRNYQEQGGSSQVAELKAVQLALGIAE